MVNVCHGTSLMQQFLGLLFFYLCKRSNWTSSINPERFCRQHFFVYYNKWSKCNSQTNLWRFSFSYAWYFTEKTIIAKPPDSKFSHDEKQITLTQRYRLLRQVKSYIDNNLYLAKVNVIDPTKDNFTQSLSIKNF